MITSSKTGSVPDFVMRVRSMAAGLLDPEFLIGASLAGDRFKIVAKVGAGSMAVVYRAFDHRLETEVVVKVPKKQKLQDPRIRERFRRESRLLVQLQHPHIVTILDVGEHGDVPYVVMQYLSGGCLLDRMQAKNGQPAAMRVDSMCTWLLEVAKALDFAHQRHVVHRDVKPANILFDESGNAFLSDFGLTKLMYGEPDADAADETAAGFVIGTPNFVAPEIVLGADYDGRADQYSLAITLYSTLIGVPPMQGKTPSATMVNQTRRVLPLLSDVRKVVPVETAVALAKATSKVPEERFATCVDFAKAAIAGLSSVGSSPSSPAPERQKENTVGNSTVRARSDATEMNLRGYPAPSLSGQPSDLRNREKSISRPKSRGVFDCPQCSTELRLREEHAGRTGRCIQCQTRLRISPNLAAITIIPTSGGRASADSSGPSSARSGDDLIFGEKVFGLKLSRKAMLVLGIVMLLTVMTAAVMFTLQLMKPDLEKNRQKLVEQFQNREG